MPVQHFPVNFTTHHQSPISPIYSPYELSSPYSTASTASSFLTDNSPISDSPFDSPTSPVEHSTDYSIYGQHPQPFNSNGELSGSYELEYALWAAEPKKASSAYHIPRSQPNFPNQYSQTQPVYQGFKVAPYIAPPVPPHQRVASQVPIHSPIPTHPLHQQRLQAGTEQPSQTVGDADPVVFDGEDWSHEQPPSVHFASHPLSVSHPQATLVPYSSSADPSSPTSASSGPRIKQEEAPVYPSLITSYASAHELLAQSHHASRTNAIPFEVVAVSQMQDPTQAYNLLSSFNNQASIGASQTQPSPEYYSPLYQQPSPSRELSRDQSSPQELRVQLPFHQQASNFSPTTVHPAEVSSISPTTASSGSPLSVYGDHPITSQDGQWSIEQRSSKSSLGSDIPIGSMDLDVASGIDMVTGMGGVEAAAPSLDDDAEGDEEWDHSEPHADDMAHVSAIYQQGHHQYLDDSGSEGEGDTHIHGAASPHHPKESGSEVDLVASSGEEFDETSSEEDDDDDDDEFVLNPRQRRSKSTFDYKRRRGTVVPANAAVTASALVGAGTPSSYSSASGGGFDSYTRPEGRSLRPRSTTTRYAPYQSHSDVGGYGSASDYSLARGAGSQNGDAYERRRYNSTSASSSASPSLSSSSLNGVPNITTTSTSRRRIRPSPSLPVPVPVPHLIKKSRGRRVPTMTSLEDIKSAASGAGKKRQSSGGRSARMYLCDVDGCGKCFARGEHLKRHVRSIHTYEKPHKCPYPGCGKDFSRHDNLGQHMRVHKDFVPPPSAVTGRKKAQQA